MKSLVVILFIIGVAVANPKYNYKLPEGTKRKLQESQPNFTSVEWKPLRIHFEFLKQFGKEDMAFLNKIFDITSTYFERYLLVRRNSEPITFKSKYPTDFGGFTISSELKAKSYDADVVIFVNVENNFFEQYLAYCGPVVFDDTTLRPIMGILSWNMFYSQLSDMSDSIFEANMETAIHETIHGLGFVDDYFDTFYDSVTGLSYETKSSYTQDSVIYLNTPRVTILGQQYFNCTTMKGIPMEDNGGSGTAGSHLERNLFYNEIMTGSDMTGNFVVTDFTFQFLQDTGFYRVTEYSPDQLLWGQNEGCGFVEKQCNGGTFPEFCTGTVKGCSFNRGGQSTCTSDYLGGTCKHQYIDDYYDCRDANFGGYSLDAETFQYFGYDSMCVNGSLAKSETSLKPLSCYKYSCDSNNILTLYIDGQTIDCSKPGPVTVPGTYFGNLECPADAVAFCQSIDECPNQCNQKGFCQNKQCVCMSGYSGKGCTDTCTDYRYKDQCLTQCPDQTYAFEDIKYCVGCPGNCESCSGYNNCTKCKKGYQLRGGFCDNYYLLTQEENLSTTSNEQTNTTQIIEPVVETNTTETTTIDTNTTATEIDTNNTSVATNQTTTDTNSTPLNNSTQIIETNSTIESNQTLVNTTQQQDSSNYKYTKHDLIVLMNSVLILLNM